MSESPTFELLPIDRLKAHEEVDRAQALALEERLRVTRRFDEPIWVARDSWVILNGHHRVEALRHLGAIRVAAWVFDYLGDGVRLERWGPGPPITKEEVLRRAEEGRLYPPKTTRHRIRAELPARSTPMDALLPSRGEPESTSGAPAPRAPRGVDPRRRVR